MANSATALNKIPINVKGSDIDGVTPVYIAIDTIAEQVTAYTPTANKRWAILGWMEAEVTAGNLTIYSDTTVVGYLEGSANRTRMHPLGQGIMFVGNVAGEALKITPSSGNPTGLLIFVAEFSQIRISF